MKKGVMLLSISFAPNVGGIETHFNDLVKQLLNQNFFVSVLTYAPITTPNVSWKWQEKQKDLLIIRIPWFKGLFYKLVSNPILEFIFLLPGLFIACPFFLIAFGQKIKTIHSHGLVAGFVAIFWGKVFGKSVLTTTHSIYNFPKRGLYRKFAKFIFNSSDHILTLSHQSKQEIIDLGIEDNKVSVFTYWIDMDRFKHIKDAKQLVDWKHKFVVLFVGRLVPEKGINVLLDSFKNWPKSITLAIAGTGPEQGNVENNDVDNLIYLGKVNQKDLPRYYSAADILIVPSVHEEGFGRVILESLACGTPVIGSSRGAIPEAMNESVGKLIKITQKNILETVNYFYNHQDILERLSRNAATYARKRYSNKNAKEIIKYY